MCISCTAKHSRGGVVHVRRADFAVLSRVDSNDIERGSRRSVFFLMIRERIVSELLDTVIAGERSLVCIFG